MRKYVLLWIFALVGDINIVNSQNLTILHEWKNIDFLWDTNERKKNYTELGLYQPNQVVPVDVDLSSDGRLFVTTIRRSGVPVTLSTVHYDDTQKQYVLNPYPKWSEHSLEDRCEGIVNAYRIAVHGDMLWVLDSGSMNNQFFCSPKLILCDTTRDNCNRKFVLPGFIGIDVGRLINIAVEYVNKKVVRVYIADDIQHDLILLNLSLATGKAKFFHRKHPFFYPEKENSVFDVGNKKFYSASGIHGLAVSPKSCIGTNRYFVFRPLSSKSIYSIDTDSMFSYMDDEKLKFISGKDSLPSQATVQAFSSSGTLYYGLSKESAIGCIRICTNDTNIPFLAKNFKTVLADSRLGFISGLKVVNDGDVEKLLILSNGIQKMCNEGYDPKEINFRIFSIPVGALAPICDQARTNVVNPKDLKENLTTDK